MTVIFNEAPAKEPRPKPLTRFMLRDGGRIYRYFLRPTKGWRREKIDSGEADMWERKGVPYLPAVPNGRAFR